jgi:hypothetical protein
LDLLDALFVLADDDLVASLADLLLAGALALVADLALPAFDFDFLVLP